VNQLGGSWPAGWDWSSVKKIAWHPPPQDPASRINAAVAVACLVGHEEGNLRLQLDESLVRRGASAWVAAHCGPSAGAELIWVNGRAAVARGADRWGAAAQGAQAAEGRGARR
jgi:hypothetical protein